MDFDFHLLKVTQLFLGVSTCRVEQNNIRCEEKLIMNRNRVRIPEYIFKAFDVIHVDVALSTNSGKITVRTKRADICQILSMKGGNSGSILASFSLPESKFPFSLRTVHEAKRIRQFIPEAVRTKYLLPYYIVSESSKNAKICRFSSTGILLPDNKIELFIDPL